MVSQSFEEEKIQNLIFSKRATFLIFLITNPERGVHKDI